VILFESVNNSEIEKRTQESLSTFSSVLKTVITIYIYKFVAIYVCVCVCVCVVEMLYNVVFRNVKRLEHLETY